MKRNGERTEQRERARDILRDELRDAVGDEAAARAEREGALDAAVDGDRPRTVAAAMSQSRMLIAVSLSVALVVGAVIALITGSWWFILVALTLHAVGTTVVVLTSLSLATDTESPDPRAAAALQAHGVTNPDAALNQAVRAAADGSNEARTAREQQTDMTPSPRSRAVDTPTHNPTGRSA